MIDFFFFFKKASLLSDVAGLFSSPAKLTNNQILLLIERLCIYIGL